MLLTALTIALTITLINFTNVGKSLGGVRCGAVRFGWVWCSVARHGRVRSVWWGMGWVWSG